MDMQIVDSPDSLTHVKLDGTLGYDEVHTINVRFLGAVATPHKHGIVDMSGVESISSLGMGMFVECAQALSNSDKKLVLFGCNDFVQGAFELAKLTAMLGLVKTKDDALACLS